MESKRLQTREIAKKFLDKNDPLGWFEYLYAIADWNEQIIPWADMIPNPNLVDWLTANNVKGDEKKALVIGCGLGDDAEELNSHGFEVTAFDISPTAIKWCQRRFPDSKVNYLVEDIFCSPKLWQDNFDFVLESYTLQTLPPDLRERAMKCISKYLSIEGNLLIITRGRDTNDSLGNMPWPLTKNDLNHFLKFSLKEIYFEDYLDCEEPPVRRFRVNYQRYQ